MLPRRPPFTHFLAIPLYTPHSASRLNNSLALFATEVTAAPTFSSSATTTADINVAPNAPGNISVFSTGGLSMTERGAFEAAAAPDKDNDGTGSGRSMQEPRTNIIKAPLPRDALRPPSSLHLTLGMMSLTDSDQLGNAASFLRSLDLNALLREAAATSSNGGISSSHKGEKKSPPLSPSMPSVDRLTLMEKARTQSGNTVATTKDKTVSADQPLVVTLQGLVPMQSLDASTVLYAVPYDPTGRLQPFCEALVAAFVEAGLMIPEDRALKLHATIVNTLHVRNAAILGGRGRGRGRGRGYDRAGYSGDQRGRGRGGGGGWDSGTNRWRERLKIDATELVQRWKDEVWAEVEVQKLVICEMGAKPSKDGLIQYKEIAQVDMPKYK